MEFDDVIRGSTDGCNRPEDQLTKLRCYSDSECTIITNGYCNSEGYCCRRGGAGVCPNGARWLGEYCNRDGDCLRVVNRAGIVRCFIGLCCTARGRQKVESEDDESPRISPAEGDLDSFGRITLLCKKIYLKKIKKNS
jgi:hypothetical protein